MASIFALAVPLPPLMLDLLFTFNIALSLIILLVVVYVLRPLDFAAVTDHPETWDQMYVCTDPEYADNEHCNGLRDFHRNRQSGRIFYDYLIPMVSSQPPSRYHQPRFSTSAITSSRSVA